VAAPSANRFTGLSPTTAEHVRAALGDRVDMILDGGATEVGIESTVITLAVDVPRILRPGMVSREAIEAVIGPVEEGVASAEDLLASPGMQARHYSPCTRLVLVESGELPAQGRGVYLHWGEPAGGCSVAMPRTAAEYAATLYATLHELDQAGWDWIAIEEPPTDAAWDGIRDRLRRAAAH
jgi:L-threonylcarbamoyladenylate synthase